MVDLLIEKRDLCVQLARVRHQVQYDAEDEVFNLLCLFAM